MKFQYIALPVLAAIGSVDAAALPSGAGSSASKSAGPETISNTASAVSSVLSAMSKQSPTGKGHTVTVTGSPIPVATTHAATTAKSAAKTTSAKAKTTSAKAKTTAKAASKKVAARAATTSSSGSTTAAAASSSVSSSAAASSAITSSAVTTASTTLSISTTSTTTGPVNVNTACAPQPNYGFTYTSTPNTLSGFLNDANYSTTASAATAPSGYTWNYSGYYGSLQQPGFMFSTQMTSYNQTACAQICTATAYCQGFDIYYERDPVFAPADACPNPTAQTSVRCAFYTGKVASTYAVNIGEWRSNFGVVIAGANGYSRT